MSKIEDIFNFRAVNERLSTSGQPDEDQLRALGEAGCEVVINLALHDDPRYSLPDEPGLVRSLGMEYVHIPVAFEQPTATDLAAFFTAMDAHRDRRLHVHCARNWRVTAFLGLYQQLRLGKESPEAFALMHDVWQPDAVWAAFIEDMQTRGSERD